MWLHERLSDRVSNDNDDIGDRGEDNDGPGGCISTGGTGYLESNYVTCIIKIFLYYILSERNVCTSGFSGEIQQFRCLALCFIPRWHTRRNISVEGVFLFFDKDFIFFFCYLLLISPISVLYGLLLIHLFICLFHFP